MRLFRHYRIPMSLTAIGGLLIICDFIRPTGMLFSINVNLLYLYLVMALLADKKWGGVAICTCLGTLLYIYLHTPPAAQLAAGSAGLTSKLLYALARIALPPSF